MASINVAETQTHLTRRRVKSNDTMRSESASWRVGRRSRPLQRRPSQVPLAHTPSASANTAKRQLDGRRDWRRLAVSGQSSRHVFWNKSGTRRSRHSHLPSISSPFFCFSRNSPSQEKKEHRFYTSLPRKPGGNCAGVDCMPDREPLCRRIPRCYRHAKRQNTQPPRLGPHSMLVRGSIRGP